MLLIATTITLFISKVRVITGRVEILDRKRTDNGGNLDCNLWFCTGSAAKRVQCDTVSFMQESKLSTLTSSPTLVPLCSKEK